MKIETIAAAASNVEVRTLTLPALLMRRSPAYVSIEPAPAGRFIQALVAGTLRPLDLDGLPNEDLRGLISELRGGTVTISGVSFELKDLLTPGGGVWSKWRKAARAATHEAGQQLVESLLYRVMWLVVPVVTYRT